MAYVVFEYCKECQDVTHHCNGKCSQCPARNERKRIAAWQSQTIEEKLTDINRRLEELERPPARY